jgi:hypothetical protein
MPSATPNRSRDPKAPLTRRPDTPKTPEPSPGDWLLGELAKANERFRAQLEGKETARRPWWRLF